MTEAREKRFEKRLRSLGGVYKSALRRQEFIPTLWNVHGARARGCDDDCVLVSFFEKTKESTRMSRKMRKERCNWHRFHEGYIATVFGPVRVYCCEFCGLFRRPEGIRVLQAKDGPAVWWISEWENKKPGWPEDA